MKRQTVFIIAIVYLSVILVLGLLFFVKHDWFAFLDSAFGPVPLGVPWFGALGAVLISLTGVFEHEKDWDESYWPWHLARPLIGIALGVVAVLMFMAGVLAAGSPAIATPNTPVPKDLLYYLIAFLVGYREETFRELIKRLVDIVLAPGGASSPVPTISGVNPHQAPHNTPTPVVITGSHFTGTQSVKFGSAAAQPFKVDSDGQITATTPAVADGQVSLTVTTKGGSASLPFTFT
ncbi:MAG: IPT/TIG domain-containing protein [Chthoniobacterales bacterium]